MKTRLTTEDLIGPIIRFAVSCVFVIVANGLVIVGLQNRSKVPWYAIALIIFAYSISILMVAIPVSEVFWKYYTLNIGRGFPCESTTTSRGH